MFSVVWMDLRHYICNSFSFCTYLGANRRSLRPKKNSHILRTWFGSFTLPYGLCNFRLAIVSIKIFYRHFYWRLSPCHKPIFLRKHQKTIAGRVLGTLQTGNITGSLMGPLLGGILADAVGFAANIPVASFSILISVVLVFTTKEFKLATKAGARTSYTRKEVLKHIIFNPVMVTVLLLSTLIQIANFSIQPILSLFVTELHGYANLAFFSGMAFSATGLGNLLMARRWGSIGDHFGHIKLLIILLFITGLTYLPGAFITEYWQLVIIRFLLGITLGGLITLRVAYIRQEAPIAMQGEVLGYNTSLQFLGNIIGPAQ